MNEQNGTQDSIEEQASQDVGRRNFLRLTGASVTALGLISIANGPAYAQQNSAWDKPFPQTDQVTVEKVSFGNRLGINIVGDMYAPKNLDRSRRSPAIIIGHPYGGVKEQSSGLYAQQMAKRGFVTLAFDNSYGGESGGSPRSIASPETFTEDFSAAADFLGTHALVDRMRIGVLGVCGSGGWAISAGSPPSACTTWAAQAARD